MAEPTSNVVLGASLAAGAVTLTGSIFGLQYDALLFGFFGGLISLMHLPAMGVVRIVATLASATIMGALFGPAAVEAAQAVAAAQASFSWVAAVPSQPARLGAALLVGLFLQMLIQLAMAFLQGRAKQVGGGA